jgi:signal transduction histidine kinase
MAVVALILLHLGRIAFNAIEMVGERDRPRRSTRQMARALVNIGFSLVISHVAQWPLAALLYVPIQAAIISGQGPRNRLVNASIHVGAFAAAMLFDGVDAHTTLLTCGGAFCVYLTVDARARMLETTLRQLEAEHEHLARAHDELANVHSRLVQRDRLTSLGMIAAGVAHEINNPMTFVTNNIALLNEDLPRFAELPEEVRRDYIEELLPATCDGIERVNAIVADLRRFARGDIEASCEYDLVHEIESAVRMVRHRFASGPRLEVGVGALPMLDGRPRQICQVLMNLLVNAAQATPKDGVVRLVASCNGQGIVVDVSDSGTGMTEATRQRIFEPFFTTKQPGDGTGLGLSVVHGIVTAHGGSVAVESTDDRGTTMRVTLPLAAHGTLAA